MKKLILNTFLGTAVTATALALHTVPASAQFGFGYSSYFVQHNFNVNLGTNPFNRLDAYASGRDFCVSPFQARSYFVHGVGVGFPTASATASGSQNVNCTGASAFSSSIATGSINNFNVLTGTTQARGFAQAFAPPGGSARATSAAALVASKLVVTPFGTIGWVPAFWSYVSGSGDATARNPRLRDPIAYTITDPTTGEVLRQGDLLRIEADYDGFGSSLEWGFTGSANPGDPGNENPTIDDNLNINFLNSGSLTIDATDAAVTNPGLFNLTCSSGLVASFTNTGRFAGISLPNIGDACTTSIPLAALDLGIDFDFTGLIPAGEVNLNFDLGGDGVAIASVPEPTSTLSLLSLGILGTGATLKRKLKSSQSLEK